MAVATQLGTLGTSTQSFADWVGSSNPSDYYAFNLTSAAAVRLHLSGLSETATLTLENASGPTLDTITGGLNADAWINTDLAPLPSGTYYIVVNDQNPNGSNGYNLSVATAPLANTAGYTLTASATAVTNIAGDTLATARVVPALSATPQSFTGEVSAVNPADVFAFTLTGTNTVNLVLSAYGAGDVPNFTNLKLLNSNGTSLQATYATSIADASISTQLGAGTYYAEVLPNSTAPSEYRLSLSDGAPAVGTAAGSNPGGSIATALDIGAPPATGATYAGWAGATHPDDYYKLDITQTSIVHLDVTGISASYSAELILRDISGNLIDQAGATPIFGGSLVTVLTTGTYYLDINNSFSTGGTGYSLTASANIINEAAGNTLAAAPHRPSTAMSAPATPTISTNSPCRPPPRCRCIPAASPIRGRWR